MAPLGERDAVAAVHVSADVLSCASPRLMFVDDTAVEVRAADLLSALLACFLAFVRHL